MSFLMGKTEQVSNVNKETEGLQKMLTQLLSGNLQGGLFPGTQTDQASMQPYLDMFTQQNSRNFAQAKEGAGTLTGSGLGNIIGAEAGRANTEQGAFLANLFEQRRQNDANRFANVLTGNLNSNAAGVQQYYQPGFLDYAVQGATGLAGGGAFNSLFKRNQQPGAAAGNAMGGGFWDAQAGGWVK
jgi:hypothetical protein